MQLELPYNRVCGLNMFGQGIYTAYGIEALAEAVAVNGTLTSVS